VERHQALIIDDDRDNAEYFRIVLSTMDFEVAFAHSAHDAVSSMIAAIPDLVLLDINLGSNLDGEDLLHLIRSNPRYEKTRVIVITGYPTTSGVVADLADLVLIKPVEMEQLKSLVARITGPTPDLKLQQFRDSVTPLYTREFFDTRLELAFARSRRRPDFLYAVITLEMRPVSFSGKVLPPEARPAVMSQIAARLKCSLRPMDTLARASGWRFITLHEELHRAEDVDVILDRLTQVLSAAYEVDFEQYRLIPRFGVALPDPSHTQPGDMLDEAELALAIAIEKT
jgi:PleD family two-component response regulator